MEEKYLVPDLSCRNVQFGPVVIHEILPKGCENPLFQPHCPAATFERTGGELGSSDKGRPHVDMDPSRSIMGGRPYRWIVDR